MFASTVAMVLALAPMVAGPTVAPRAVAQECTGSDTTDDYSLQCAPAAVPDFNDQLSEAEVAEPGFNGGGGGGGMGGGGHGGGGGGHR